MTTETSELRIVREQVRDYIQQNFLFGNTALRLEDDTSLLGEGIVDETGMLEIVLFVEETYGLIVAEEDLGPANFDTLASIAGYVVDHLPPEG